MFYGFKIYFRGYGLIGTCFYSIFSIISSFTDYSNKYIYIVKSNGFKSYYDYFFSSKEKEEILIEIIELVSGMITSYIINYNFLIIIKYLTPVHIVLLTPIYYFLFKLVLIIYNIIYCSFNDWNRFFDTNKIPRLYAKFTLDVFQDIFSLFGFLIYLEIIELKCFGLNYNLREKIINRADHELLGIDECTSSTEESINDDINGNNSDDSIESIINISNNSNVSY